MSKFNIEDKLCLEDKSYNKGLEDAWGLLKRIYFSTDHYTNEELENIFGTCMVTSLTPQEAVAKMKEYEKHNWIKVGDVVRLRGCFIDGIVTKITEKTVYCLFRDGSCYGCCSYAKKDFEKIGHYDSIDEFFSNTRLDV